MDFRSGKCEVFIKYVKQDQQEKAEAFNEHRFLWLSSKYPAAFGLFRLPWDVNFIFVYGIPICQLDDLLMSNFFQGYK
jgi:hypothetical protein